MNDEGGIFVSLITSLSSRQARSHGSAPAESHRASIRYSTRNASPAYLQESCNRRQENGEDDFDKCHAEMLRQLGQLLMAGSMLQRRCIYCHPERTREGSPI